MYKIIINKIFFWKYTSGYNISAYCTSDFTRYFLITNIIRIIIFKVIILCIYIILIACYIFRTVIFVICSILTLYRNVRTITTIIISVTSLYANRIILIYKIIILHGGCINIYISSIVCKQILIHRIYIIKDCRCKTKIIIIVNIFHINI